jgi:hypothetical protein
MVEKILKKLSLFNRYDKFLTKIERIINVITSEKNNKMVIAKAGKKQFFIFLLKTMLIVIATMRNDKNVFIIPTKYILFIYDVKNRNKNPSINLYENFFSLSLFNIKII